MPDSAILLLLLLAGTSLLWAYKYRRRIRETLVFLRDATIRAATAESLRLIHYQQSRPQPVFPQPDGVSPFAAGKWKQIGGDGTGWERNLFYKVRGLACRDDELFASLTGPETAGPRSEIWCWNGQEWRRVGGRETGPCACEASFVEHLTCYRGQIYAAAANGIWRLDDDEWQNVTGGLPVDDKGSAYAFCEWRGQLVVGFWGRPLVAVFDGAEWTKIPPPADGWGGNARTIYCLAAYKDALYAGTGTGALTGPSSTVWRYDGNSWEQLAGNGIRGSWIQEGIPFLLSLTVFGDYLVATLSRPPGTPVPTSNVWAFDGDEWMPVGQGRTPDMMARSLIMNDAIVYNDRLVVATGDGKQRHAELWELDADQKWKAVGGDAFRAPDNTFGGGYWIYRLCTDKAGNLYAGTAGHQGAARVFRYQS